MIKRTFLLASLFALGCSAPADDPPTGSAAQSMKDSQGWVHAWIVIAPDHEYEGDVLWIDGNGDADLVYRRNAAAGDGGVDVVTETATGVPCWKPRHPIALTAGPPYTAFAYPTPDPRDGYPGAIDVTQDGGSGTLTVARGTAGGIATSVLDNADEHPESWAFPMWYAWPVYPVPDDVAAIMANRCKATGDAGP